MFTSTVHTSGSWSPFILFLSKTFFWLGILCFVIVLNISIFRSLPVPKPVIKPTTAAERKPAEILINDANIDLPIFPATLTKGIFETTNKGASYLLSSPLPGNKGNSIIYAHNWISLFGNLHAVHPGGTITVIFSDKSQKTFTVTQTKTVTAHEISILQPSNDNRLTLFTCANFLDADRFVVIAEAK